jgi:membrane protease YdiL (CAAX protease family)
MREGSVGEGGAAAAAGGGGGEPGKGGGSGLSAGGAVLLGLEFFVLYVAIPTAAAVNVQVFRYLLFPSLIGGSLLLGVVLWRDRTFDRRQLLNARALSAWWWRVLALVGLFAVALWGAMAWLDPSSLLYLPRERPALWVMICVFYPLFSVYPQEVIFRTWLFHRYRALMPRVWVRVAASTLAFGYAHVMFQSWLSVALTMVGGFVFARTYVRSRSTLVAAVEHGLYGVVIFTVGLGRYFYLGAVGQ